MEIDTINLGRIGVLMGGASSEREVSLKSGEAVYQSLKAHGQEVVAIDIKTEDWWDNHKIIQEAQTDIAFIALHGTFGEDGQIQTILEQMNIPYTGSGPVASRLAMDKALSRRIFQDKDLPVPRYVVLDEEVDSESLSAIVQGLKSPLVVKPAAQGSSIGLSIIEEEGQLEKAARHAFSFGDRIIIEEYIPGREITVGILGDSALPVIEIVPQNKFYDYEAKYKPGKSNYVVPADLPVQVSVKAQNIAQAAHANLGCAGFSRVDMRLSTDGIPYVLEVNSIPGLTSASLLPKAARVAGIDLTQLCMRILHLAYERMVMKK